MAFSIGANLHACLGRGLESRSAHLLQSPPPGGIEDIRRIVAIIERAASSNQVRSAGTALLYSPLFLPILSFSLGGARPHHVVPPALSFAQSRLISRALRHNTPVRLSASKTTLQQAVIEFIPEDVPARASLLQQVVCLPEDMEEEQKAEEAKDASDATDDDKGGVAKTKKEAKPKPPRITVMPEVRRFLTLPTVVRWTKSQPCSAIARPHHAVPFARPRVYLGARPLQVEVYLGLAVLTALLRHDHLEEAGAAAEALFVRVQSLTQRSLDPLRAKVFFYFSLIHERRGSLASIRPRMLAAHRTACLQHDEMGQATLLNLILRDLLLHNLVEQAYKLVSKSTFPEKASNNQFCRYLYFTGRISALQVHLHRTDLLTAAALHPASVSLTLILKASHGSSPLEASTFLALVPTITLTHLYPPPFGFAASVRALSWRM